ncbi:MAG: protein kinase [Acidobacteria bacterium]|nr:protein kinase [Acidobacteriota bacterium]
MPDCRVCGHEVAEDQESCPSCGAVQEPVVEMSVAPNAEDPVDAAPSEEPVVEGVQADTGEVGQPEGAATTTVASAETDGKKSGLKPLAQDELLNNRYKISRKIGGGGMGAVYLAADQNLGGVERAVKEMVQSSIEEDQQRKAIEDFRRESMILSTLDHPSIPTIYDYFFDDSQGRFYLVMKYISGGDLAGRLRAAPGGRIDEQTVTEWAIQVCEVLAYLHGLPSTIVYRDLKPSNIMLDGNTGRVMLIDFGIARSINAEEKGVTAVGTMGYAPPELFSGQVEPRSDIYSLGSTMFHLLTGADPQNNPLLIFDFQKNPRPRQINPQLSDQMERILMRAVEYNADHRFSSAEEMRRVLVEHSENLKRGAVTYGVTETPAAVSLANQTVFCGFCGQRIIATDLFCAFCGSKQPIAQQGVHAEIYRPLVSGQMGRTAKLVIEGTSELDAPVFALEKTDNLVGRRDPMSNIFPEIDLSRYDPQTKISRRHARIWREGEMFLVEDLGSSNGTTLVPAHEDTVRLQPHHPYALGNGDRLRMGDTTLHFMKG